MADYLSPTVVQPSLPMSDITDLEFLVLSKVFDETSLTSPIKPVTALVYFCTSSDTNENLYFDRTELADALVTSTSKEDQPFLVDKARSAINSSDDDLVFFEVNQDEVEGILQGIIRRSKDDKAYITITTSFTCSKMRPEAFGGSICLITKNEIVSMSTNSWLSEKLSALSLSS